MGNLKKEVNLLSYGIKTDKGIIRLGSYYRVTDDPDVGNVFICDGIINGTNLIEFFGIKPPWKVSDEAPEYRAKLLNGNSIGVKAWLSDNSQNAALHVNIYFYKKGVYGVYTYINTEALKRAKVATYIPAVELSFLNGFYDHPPGYRVEWGLATKATDRGSVPVWDVDKPPYKYRWGWSLNQVSQKDGIRPDFAWLNEFCEGSTTPQFPGPDNEKDPEGGDGDGPDAVEDDKVEVPEDPGITVADAGLLTLYTPTLSQIHAFGDFLWSDLFSLDTFKKLFADPMQAVFGLSIVPVDVPAAGTQDITIGNVPSGVSANRAASQYVRKDCGTIAVKPVWNTALDFEPYTKFSVYLPFIGTRELKTDDIMGKNLNITYLVDVLSGACTAHLSVNGSVLYQFSGSCATPVPLSSMNWNGLVSSMVQLAAAGIASAVTGGAAVPTAAGALTTAAGMVGNKPNIQRTGAVSGAAGMLGVKNPYLIRETPRQSLAKDYAHYNGYPSNITSLLNDLKGFTVVESMHLKNIGATGAELAEIEGLLKEGVLL